MKNNWFKKNTTLFIIVGTVITAGSFYGALNVLGYDLPRPAWSNELYTEVAERIGNRLDFLYFKRKQAKKEWYDNQERYEQYEPGERPDWILEQRVIIEEELEQTNSEIKKLEQSQ